MRKTPFLNEVVYLPVEESISHIVNMGKSRCFIEKRNLSHCEHEKDLGTQ